MPDYQFYLYIAGVMNSLTLVSLIYVLLTTFVSIIGHIDNRKPTVLWRVLQAIAIILTLAVIFLPGAEFYRAMAYSLQP